MKRIMLLTSLILLAITGCKSKVEQASISTNTVAHPLLTAKNEKACLTNFSGSLAGCEPNTSKQKRFVLVRSVAIPEN